MAFQNNSSHRLHVPGVKPFIDDLKPAFKSGLVYHRKSWRLAACWRSNTHTHIGLINQLYAASPKVSTSMCRGPGVPAATHISIGLQPYVIASRS